MMMVMVMVMDILGFWTLDPIDGTKGFLRGGQYAVCLALLVDARVELGVIGCPNLPSEPPSPPSLQNTNTTTNTTNTTDTKSSEAQDRGALFIAVRGQGAYQLPLHPPTSTPNTSGTGTTSAQQQQPERRQRLRLRLSMPRLVPHDLSFLESYERAHAALDTNALVASRLGVHAQPVRMDSQAKYAALVRGDAGGGVYLRLPVALGKNGDGGGGGGGGGGGYQEKIWVRALKLCPLLYIKTFVYVCVFHRNAGPRAWVAPRRRGRWRHLGLSRAATRLWPRAHAR
jgi:3'(2'), 5'-bisphosphate nucleotidase